MEMTLTPDMDLLPKHLMQFIENKAERAIEVLREIIEAPEHEPQQAFIGSGLAQGLGNMLGAANQFNQQQVQQWPPSGTIWTTNAVSTNTAGLITGAPNW